MQKDIKYVVEHKMSSVCCCEIEVTILKYIMLLGILSTYLK